MLLLILYDLPTFHLTDQFKTLDVQSSAACSFLIEVHSFVRYSATALRCPNRFLKNFGANHTHMMSTICQQHLM